MFGSSESYCTHLLGGSGKRKHPRKLSPCFFVPLTVRMLPRAGSPQHGATGPGSLQGTETMKPPQS